MSAPEGLKETGSLFEYVITNHRWFFVVFFLFPMSFIYDIFLFIWSIFVYIFYPNKPSEHANRVEKIRKDIREWVQDGCKTKLCTARPGWQAMSLRAGRYKSTYRNIKVDLYDVLEINEDKQTCKVEPMCSMGKLTHYLLPKGWTIPVVPELDDLTVGGLVAGVGIETSSHKYGLFQHICLAFEVVLADGSLINCSANENSDLFYSIPWSHGTLGFVVSVELRMIRAHPYVDLTYLPFHTKKEAIFEFSKHSQEQKYDFVECLAYSNSKYVVMIGNYCDTKTLPGAIYNPIGLWYKEWFYKHVEKFLYIEKRKNSSIVTENIPLVATFHREIIPLRHYYHRHTKGLFWEMSDIVPFGNHIIFRYLLGWLMPPKPSLLKRTQTEALRKLYEQHHMVQDMLVPMSKLDECLDVFHNETAIYPLWLCPFKIPSNKDTPSSNSSSNSSSSNTTNVRRSTRLSTTTNSMEHSQDPGSLIERGFIHAAIDYPKVGMTEEIFVDVGAYGNPSVSGYEAKATHRRIEDFVRSVKGYQMMYADSYMTREEFREMFDHSLYDKMRAQLPLCTQAFPEVYDKVSKAARI